MQRTLALCERFRCIVGGNAPTTQSLWDDCVQALVLSLPLPSPSLTLSSHGGSAFSVQCNALHLSNIQMLFQL